MISDIKEIKKKAKDFAGSQYKKKKIDENGVEIIDAFEEKEIINLINKYKDIIKNKTNVNEISNAQKKKTTKKEVQK